jgi:hypothetical protein
MPKRCRAGSSILLWVRWILLAGNVNIWQYKLARGYSSRVVASIIDQKPSFSALIVQASILIYPG